MYKELKSCIICNSEVEQVLDLGTQYVVDFVKEKDEKLLKAPLTLMRCKTCSFIQLKHQVNPDRLYKKFWYRSGINKMMQDELLMIVKSAAATVNLEDGDKALDIGCNDGTLLGWYQKGVQTFGIDPCSELVQEGLQNGKIDIGVSDFFSADAVTGAVKKFGAKSIKFKIITAISCFYDVDNPVKFLKDCKSLLHDEGVIVIQMNYLVKMLQDTALDNICHEHLGYYSVLTLKEAVDRTGLEIQGVEESPCNGGSIRCYITHKGWNNFASKSNSNKMWLLGKMNHLLMQEMRLGLEHNSVYANFVAWAMLKLANIRTLITKLPLETLYVYGASTRGTVLMQALCKEPIAPDYFKGVAERDAHKIGLKMVGTWLPIISEEEFREKATHALILPWHFKSGIIEREKAWLQKGGKFIVPLPEPMVVEHDHEAAFVTTSKKL